MPALAIALSACPDLISLGMGACRSFLREHPWVMELSEAVPAHVPRDSVRWYCVVRGQPNLCALRRQLSNRLGY